MRLRWVLLVVIVCMSLFLLTGNWVAARATDRSPWVYVMFLGWFMLLIIPISLVVYLSATKGEAAPIVTRTYYTPRHKASLADELPPDAPPELRAMLSRVSSSDLTDLNTPRRSTLTVNNALKVEPGGGVLLRARSPAELRVLFEKDRHAPLALLDLGMAYVFQLRIEGADTEVLGVMVDRGGVYINAPAAARLPEALRDIRPLDGVVVLYKRGEDLIVPSTAIAQMWSDYLRIVLYKDKDMDIKGEDEVILKPRPRDGPAPQLLFPEERLLTPPPIVQLRVDDTADAYEVVVELPEASTAQLAYEGGDRELILTVTTSRVVETTKGSKEERRIDKYTLSLPEPIVPGSPSGRRHRDTFRIHTQKAVRVTG